MWTRELRRLCLGISILLSLISARSVDAAGKSFYGAWSDGNGEVNSYELTEERYGELRLGHAVLVYVAEELNRNTYVKVESNETPLSERMFVVKLNKSVKFPTGIYDYSSMTSVFSVADSHLEHPAFQAARVSHSTQEWCGQVFARLDLREDGWDYILHSYFEAEGDVEASLPAAGTDLEDNLWIKIRELDGPWMSSGETKLLSLYPALWESRKSHRRLKAAAVEITKGNQESYRCGLGEMDAVPWNWVVGNRAVTAWVEASGAHRVLGWEDSLGGIATLVRSERLPYWGLHDLDDQGVRARFRLPDFRLEDQN